MKIKRLVISFAVCLLMLPIMCITAFATAEASFYIPSTAVSAGDSFSVSVEFIATENIGSLSTAIHYDSSVIQFVSGNGASGSGGTVNLNCQGNSQKNMTCALTFKAVKSGTASLSLSGCSVYSSSNKSIGSPTAYAYVTVGNAAAGKQPVEETEKHTKASSTAVTTTAKVSDNNEQTSQTKATENVAAANDGYLKNITVSTGTLVPAFSSDVYNYTLDVPYSVTKVEIDGIGSQSSDALWYTGYEKCNVGKNVRTITSTGTSGKKSTYTLVINRASDDSEIISDESSKSAAAVNKTSDSSTVDTFSQYRKIITPALIIVLVVLIIALFVIIFWVRGKLKQEKKEYKESRQSSKSSRKKPATTSKRKGTSKSTRKK